MQLILRLLINATALWAATRLVSGISFMGDWRFLFAVALLPRRRVRRRGDACIRRLS
jgi:uncharacterized membrane protein YvlD (DUF360 family)